MHTLPEKDFKESVVDRAGKLSALSPDSAVGGDLQQFLFPVRDQPQRILVAVKSRLRRAKYRANQIIVKERSSQGELRLFQCENP